MGLVLVFDLDQTIIDSSDPFLFNRPDTPEGIAMLMFRAKTLLNFRLVNDVIKRAARLRGKKDAAGNDLIAGIFLLTNNASKIMVSAVDSVLRDEIAIKNPEGSVGKYKTAANKDPYTEGMPDKSYFFDSIMMRGHPERTPGPEPNSPLKGINDIRIMLEYIGKTQELITRDSFFFDDMEHPGMRPLFPRNYITIEPAFTKLGPDRSNYSSIIERLAYLDGQPKNRLPPSMRSALTVSRTPVAPPPVFEEPVRTFGRNRSGTLNEGAGNNMEIPSPKSPSGGRRKTRLSRKNRRNKSRKRLRK